MRIRSFCALRPAPDKVEQIAALPYDVVKTEEARELAANNPLSLLHVTRAEIDFEPGTDPYSDAVYDRAVANFKHLLSGNHLVCDEKPSLFIYQQQMGVHVQQGVVALCHIEDYLADRIKKHEKTRKDKEDDRTRLTGAMAANAGPVFLTYREQSSILDMVAASTKEAPLFAFTAPDGIQHKGWRVLDPEALISAFSPISAFYVADGHHRAASAARVGLERKAANPLHRGDEDYNWFLTVLFPGSQLKILPYNRLVQHLNGHTPASFLNAVKAVCVVEACDHAQPAEYGRVCMYLNKQWYEIRLPVCPANDPVDSLDVSGLQSLILAPLLGVEDPRTASHIEFVGGVRGTDYLVNAVDSGDGAVAFSMYPVTVEQLMSIADSGGIMPPKSTWFEPKLRSGLFIHSF